jgi:type II secretory pathway component PulK
MVALSLAVLMPFAASFNYEARVDYQTAVNVRDEIAARHVERGAFALSLLLFELQRQVFNQREFREMVGPVDITQAAPYIMSVFGTVEGAGELGELVGIDTTALSVLALDSGTFEFRVEAESGKINVNCLANQVDARLNFGGWAAESLELIMRPTLYDPLFEEEKLDGQRYEREDIVQALADYIDEDTRRIDLIRMIGGSQGEDDRYGELFDPYEPRNARLDSLLELHLVRGIDDDWMAAFSPRLTVYGGCKVNPNFGSAEQIAQAIRHATPTKYRWMVEGDNFEKIVLPLAHYVVEARAFVQWDELIEFRDFLRAPDQGFNPSLLRAGDESEAKAILERIPEGISVRRDEDTRAGRWGGLREVTTVAPETIYRVEVITSVGAVRRRATAVYDMQFQRQQSQGKGTWMHYRRD